MAHGRSKVHQDWVVGKRWPFIIVAALLVASCGSSRPISIADTTTTTAPFSSTNSLPVLPAHRQWLNLAYATRSLSERLDLYLPAGGIHPGLVMYVHGGGYTGGDKANAHSLTLVSFLLLEGYAVASVNYRLSSQAVFPAQIQDIKAAVRWLRANALRYGFDPEKIAAAGDSAGGNLVALLATSPGVAALDDPSLGHPGVSTAIRAAIIYYPDIDFLSEARWLAQNPACIKRHYDPNSPSSFQSRYLGAAVPSAPIKAKAANPITYLAPGKPLPRILIAHGDVDCYVPYQGSVEFYNAVVRVAGPGAARLIIVKGSGHYPNFDSSSVRPVAIELLHDTIGS